MAIFNDFPYSNLHNENLQWIIDGLKQTESNIDDINNSIKQINSDIENLDLPANITQITSNFKNDYFIICGDSYCVERNDYKTWPMLLRDRLNLPEINYQNISIGGYGFVGESGTHLSQLMAAEIQADVKKVTKIFVGCGYNDRNATVSAINEAMIQYDKYVRSTFPNAEITLIFAACDNNRANWENLAKVKLAYAYGSRLGWAVIDIHCFIGGMYYMRDDGHHPSHGPGKIYSFPLRFDGRVSASERFKFGCGQRCFERDEACRAPIKFKRRNRRRNALVNGGGYFAQRLRVRVGF